MPLLKLPNKALLAAALLAGCASGDPSTKVELAPLAREAGFSPLPSSLDSGVRAAAAWWRAFGDPDLDRLVARALAENPDLATAAARVRESRALLIAVDADLLPRLDAQLALSSRRLSNQTGQNFPGMPRRTDVGTAGVQLSWEIDLWGRAADRSLAALGDAESAAFRAAAAEVSLAAEVARAWFAVRLAREDAACLAADFDSRVDAIGMVELQVTAGVADGDALSAARLAAAQAKADELDAVRRLGAAENALRVLVGLPAGAVLPGTQPDLKTAPSVASQPSFGAGLPSELLLARPDIRAAERALDAALAREGSARAEFYPKLMLVGDAGWSADPAGNVGRSGSGFWALTPSLSLPIFDGARNAAGVEVAQARVEAAAAGWKSAVLNAFREVDNALIDLRALATQEDLAGRVLAAVGERLANAEARARAGLADRVEVEAARRDVFLARRTFAGYAWQRRQAAARLAAATGGGFPAGAGKGE